MTRLIALFSALVLLTACAQQPGEQTREFNCGVNGVSAGDVIFVSCLDRGMFPVQVAGINSPQIDFASCEVEELMGRAARIYATSLFETAARVRIIPEGTQNNRRAARFILDGTDFGERMIAAGHAVPFTGTRVDWCEV
ncbi:MAG: hypothetical protein AAFQ36_00940 [Pseudomonadota bacterium]